MNIAVIHPFLYTRGGAERVVLRIAEHFNAKIYCTRYEPDKTFPEFKDIDIEVVKTGLWKIMPPGLPVRVRDALIAGYEFYTKKLEGYDIVNAQGTPSEWIRNRNRPVVWFVHTPNREAFDLYSWRMSQRNLPQKALYWSAIQPYKILEKQTVPKIEHLFANSRNTQERLKKYLNRDSEILNPGVEYEKFFCERYEKYFLYPSRITPEKRFDYAIKAFKIFKKKNPDWKLIIAGALMHDRPDHHRYYEKLKRMLGSDGEFLLNLDEKKFSELFANCYSILYTPINEDFGIIPLEALASYKPCIAVNEGGPREIIENGKNGFLVNSEEEMAEKMSLLAADKNLVEKMGRHGRKHVEKNFSWDRFLKRFEEVCRNLVKR